MRIYIKLLFYIYNMSSSTYINDVWSLYFHDPYDMNWDANSYKFITTISSVEDFVNIYKAFDDLWLRGMFFIMREHIMPRWEDENNINGGCLSFKVNKQDFNDKLFEVASLILGETMGKTDMTSMNINGLSISPKKNYHIIRIWLKNNDRVNKNLFNLHVHPYSVVMYKPHNESI